MPFTLQVKQVQFFDVNPILYHDGSNAYPDCDGAVWYLVLEPCTCEVPCEISCPAHPHEHHSYYQQPFARGSNKFRAGSTAQEQAEDRANVWGWNGDRAAPSLAPSFLIRGYKEGEVAVIGGKQTIMCARPCIHLFLTSGAIQLCSDSTVTLHPDPKPCHEGSAWP